MNTYEDDEFNRIEMESRVRQEYVRQSMRNLQGSLSDLDKELGIPIITQEELEALMKDY